MAADQAVQASAKPRKSTTYIPALDGLRAIAFFCVFGAHTNNGIVGKFVPATFGVTLFFFLSGYLIVTLLRGEAQRTGTIALKDFYIRRTLRIFIPMYLAFASCLLINKLFFGDWHLSPIIFWSSILYFFNYAHLLHPLALFPRGFDVIWSLSVEEHFYLLFPLMYLVLLRRRVSREAQACLVLGLCVVGLCWRTWVSYHNFPAEWTYFETDCRFDSIMWGSLLALWWNPIYDERPRFLARYGGVLAALAFFTIVGSMTIASVRYRDTLRYSFQGFCLFFIFQFAISSIMATGGHWSVRWLENRALRYVGWISYSLYLIHMSFQHVFELHPWSHWITSPAVFALAFTYAFVVRHTVELPLQKLRARFRHAAPPVSTTIPVEGI